MPPTPGPFDQFADLCERHFESIPGRDIGMTSGTAIQASGLPTDHPGDKHESERRQCDPVEDLANLLQEAHDAGAKHILLPTASGADNPDYPRRIVRRVSNQLLLQPRNRRRQGDGGVVTEIDEGLAHG